MKIKIFYSLLFGILIFAGCNKAPDQSPSNSKAKLQFDLNDGGFTRVFNGTDCSTQGNKCYWPPVEVNYPPQVAAYTSFQTAVAGGAGAIGTYFTTGSWLTIFPGLDSSYNSTYLTKLQSGTYSMLTQTSGTTEYYFAGTGTFTIPDAEFVFQVND